ncbi:flagellar motor protein MotA [Acidocella sp. KAb 2-4]|uniref:flagellar motor protein MotA n=1 Tax=Acidocella sp. KAb 2-4 TaxID=2885158 RepID=UPI001D097E17|nr:flagellar motor protein MotA [Acidocella sp. KAb 2-4]MCB5943712.1 flagellar motor protein MotA [Acidocella sp. KAb 2-4]
MTKPTNYLIRMILFCVVVYSLAALLSPELSRFFLANPVVNSVIVAVEFFGVFWNLRQVQRLYPEAAWVEEFRRNRQRLEQAAPPVLLAPMARMLHGRADGERRITLSGQAMRTILDGISSRLDESRELSRYTTGVMIFLGLLGTFWGLLRTVNSVAEVINGMNLAGGDVNAMFSQLKNGLTGPLAGMGTAFSSSMFGLSGALILGFLDLTAGQAMNRFFNELEEWLAGLTRLSTGALAGDGEGSIPVYVQALLEQTAENMDQLQRVLARGEEGRAQSSAAVVAMTERLAHLSDTLRVNQQLMEKIGAAQMGIAPVLSRLAEPKPADEVARAHLRNIELLLSRLLTESEQGRSQSLGELRSDLKVLTRTIAGLADHNRP